MANHTTVSLDPDDKPAVDKAQDRLEEEIGIRPTKGETVARVCRDYVENTD